MPQLSFLATRDTAAAGTRKASRAWPSCVAVLLVMAGAGHSRSVGTVNAIQAENAKAGTTDWKLTRPGRASGVIEGYASATSVNTGGSISLFVNTKEPTYQMDVFRLGYYGGLGARRMLPAVTLPGVAQPPCPMSADTGLVECNWIDPYTLSIPTTWISGLYLVKLTAGTTGTQQYITFAVRDEQRYSDILMIQAVNTYQAYNVWGGKSLYGTIANRGDTANKAVKVSFNRPYYGDESNGASNLDGLVPWERDMLFFLEKEGYDVSYATDVDTDDNPALLLNHKAVQVVGHSEYWSWAMFDNFERARDAGVNLFFTSGNTAYWQVRYEPSAIDGAAARVMVGYKELLAQDPQRTTQYATTEFRLAPVNRPEDQLLGVRFTTQARPPFCVEDASSWIFTGTGLKNGDCLRKPEGPPFLGYEVDAMGPFSPPNAQRVAHSPATPRYAHFSDMTVYRAASGATVVDTGSISWSQTIPAIQQVTRNVLSRMISGAFTDTVPVRPGIAPFSSADIGDVGRAGFVALGDATSFTLNGAGSNAPFSGRDALFYAYQPLAGDGEIVVRLTSCQNFWDNRCGIAIREDLTPTSRSVALLGTPSESSGSLQEGAEFRVKAAIAGHQNKLGAADLPQPDWLKLVRSGNVFSGFVSADGNVWTMVGTATLSMNGAAYIGAVVQGAQRGVWVTAVFDHVAVQGAGANPPGDTTAPVVSLTSPASGSTVAGTIALAATASDDTEVGGVQFAIDGTKVGAEDTSVPYSVTFDTTTAANGPHTVTATARDGAGNVSTASATITVSNTGASVLDRTDWTATASESSPTLTPAKALDGSLSTRFASGRPQHPGQTFTVSWPGDRTVSRIRIDVGSSSNDYPHSCTIALFDHTGDSHSQPCGVDAKGNVDVSFAALPVDRIVVTQTGNDGHWWSIAEINAFGPAAAPPPTACASVALSKTTYYSGAPASAWTVSVTAPMATCTWQVVPDSNWIVVGGTAPTPPAGNGSFVLKTLSNATGIFRTGHFTVAGATYTVKQEP